MGDVAAFTRLQHQVAHPVAAQRFVLPQRQRNAVVFTQAFPQHHGIFHRRTAALANIRRGAVRGIAEQRDVAAHQAVERLNVVDFNAVGGLGIQRRDKRLHRRRPAAEVAREIGAQGGAILCQARGQRHVKKEVETAAGDGHQRHAFAFANEGGPLVRRGNLFINLHQPVPVHVPGVAARRGVSQHVRTNRRVAAVGGNQKIACCRGAIGKGHAHARLVFMNVFHTLAELHPVATPEVQHFALEFSARDGAGTPSGTLNQRGKAKAGQGLAAPVIFVGHKTHRTAVSLDDVAHAEVLHAFHAVWPDGDSRPDGPDLSYGFKHGTVDARFLQRDGGAQAANSRTNNDCFHASLLLQGVKPFSNLRTRLQRGENGVVKGRFALLRCADAVSLPFFESKISS